MMPIARPGEEDRCVWQEIGDLVKTFVVAFAWFCLITITAGSAAALVVLRYMAA